MTYKKTKKIKHAVVLVNYKVAKDTIACVKSIEQCKDQPHIIVVDNGSSNEVIQELRDACPDIDLILAGSNIGFSAGNNLGISKALKLGAQVIYILNNDTLVDPNLFFRAFRYVERKNRITGGKIYYAKGYEFHGEQKGRGDVLWYAGGYFNWASVIAAHYGVDEVDRGQYDKVRPVEFITGCFIAVPAQVFRKIGLLDEPFFLYLEDTDFSLHAKKMGIEVMYNPNLVVYHCNSSATVAGSPLVDYYITRNRFFIGHRYGSLRLRFALLREALFRNWDSPIRRQAFFDYLFGRMGNRNEKILAIVAQTKK
ncbi:MAG: putative glycosyltransferase [Microgenomates group bacterium GW2011_GWC2_46_7]|nr:MAG: putative glycosyltransferase [Microgenomates group bacterium GW2011_GWC2_46_7]